MITFMGIRSNRMLENCGYDTQINLIYFYFNYTSLSIHMCFILLNKRHHSLKQTQ